MHLLDSSTHKLHEFQGMNIPDYAILSHRWDTDEVSFQDLRDRKGLMEAELVKTKETVGWAKIKGCCDQAVSDGWKYVWIDSCCIDKSSSTELSEAINSMFQWYQNAQVCYAYLTDVPAGDFDHHDKRSAFSQSKWFTRGWTLQELLAPPTVIFFNHDWIEIGTKSSLHDAITFRTGIQSLANFQEACVAQKMSWASKRKTTRIEDMAYCLMGLFGVSMPPLYGEGEYAFRRLQLEILNKSDDESIFAWEQNGYYGTRGLLASSPSDFNNSGHVQRFDHIMDRPPFSMANKGLRMELLLSKDDLADSPFARAADQTDVLIAPINCKQQGSSKFLALYLLKTHGNQFQRVANTLASLEGFNKGLATTQLVYVREDVSVSPSITNKAFHREYAFLIRSRSLLEKGFSISRRYITSQKLGKDGWETNADGLRAIIKPKIFSVADGGALMFRKDNEDMFILVFDIDGSGRAGLNILIPEGGHGLKEAVKSFWNNRYEKYQKEKEQPLRLDRISKPVGTSWVVVVSVRKKSNLDEKIYVIDITTKEK